MTYQKNNSIDTNQPKLLDQVRAAIRMKHYSLSTEKTTRIPMNKMMSIQVKYGEIAVGKLVKAASGQWDRERKVWNLPYKEILELGLENRIIKRGEIGG